jgi:hypothetical protein
MTAGATAVVVAAGTGISFAQTLQFGTDQVGQLTDKGLVVSDDQYIDPIGERLVVDNGKIMSSSVSPDGTHLAASVADGGMALAIVDLKTWKVQQLVGNNAAANLRISGNDVGQEGPTHVLARRLPAVAGPGRRLPHVHREPGRHPGQPGVHPDPAGRGQARAGE